eukprot:gene11886-5213_t
MEEERSNSRLKNALFHFPHAPPDDDQSTDGFKETAGFISTFITKLTQNQRKQVNELDEFNTEEIHEVEENFWSFEVYPEYGGVLFLEYLDDDVYQFKMVALDKWILNNRISSTKDVFHDSISTDYSIYVIESVHKEQIDKFMEGFNISLQNSKKKTGNNRTAAGSKKGQQKTPAFLFSMFKNAIDYLKMTEEEQETFPEGVNLPQGGTTDVGLHTGGRARGTNWPLMKWLLTELVGEFLFSKFYLHFILDIFEETLENMLLLKSELVKPIEIKEIVTMHKEVVKCFTDLNKKNFTFQKIQERIEECHKKIQRIENFIFENNVKRGELETLKDENIEMLNLNTDIDLLKGNFFYSNDHGSESSTLPLYRSKIIGAPKLPTDSSTYKEIYEWMKEVRSIKSIKKSSQLLLILNTVFSIFQKQTHLLTNTSNFLKISDFSILKQICELYSKCSIDWLKIEEGSSSMNNIIRSNELLLYWIITCFIHQNLKLYHQLVNNYSMPISWEVLSVVITDSKETEKMVLEIAQYVYHNSIIKKKLFHPTDQSGTFDFAYLFSKNDFDMNLAYKIEKENITIRERKYNYEIAAKKADLKDLKEKLNIQIEKYNLNHSLYCNSNNYYDQQRYLNQRNKANSLIDSYQNQINQTRIPPPFMVHPLPRQELYARRVLFFYMMPKELDIYSWFCFESQNCLIPKHPCNRIKECTTSYSVQTSGKLWKTHHSNHSDTQLTFNSTFFNLFNEFQIPYNFGKNSVESIYDASEKSFYPDATMYFQAEPSINPFKVQKDEMKIYFSEKIGLKEIQWAVDHPEENKEKSTRGNDIFGKRINFPEFSPKALNHFSELRAFPNNQFTKLLQIIHEQLLPFGNESVRTLILQSLYQIGKLDFINGTILQKWHVDRNRNGGFEYLSELLSKWAENIASRNRDHQEMPLLCELTNYVSQYNSDASDISRKLADICLDWANLLFDQMEKETEVAIRLSLRAKQCLMFGYGILNFKYGNLSKKDIQSVIMLHLKFRDGLVYKDHLNEDLIPLLEKIRTSVDKIITMRIGILVNGVNESILTNCIRQIDNSAPQKLQWSSNSKSFGLFSAEDKNAYSVNLLLGTVLINGNPPGRLPNQILDHPLYIRCFGNRDFEVVRNIGGSSTTRWICDDKYLYEFILHQNQLFIKEIDTESEENSLILVDYFQRLEWDKQLPVRLLEMHSHWYNPKMNILVLRNIEFNQRVPQFIIDFNESKCFIVKQNSIISQLHFTEIHKKRKEMNQIIKLKNTNVLKVLEKFEDPSYIHLILNHKSKIQIHFTRFHLTFTLEENKLISEEHRGFHLHHAQNLSDSLMFFDQYLVLKNEKMNETKLLVPNGNVISKKNRIKIEFSEKLDAHIEHHVLNQMNFSNTFKSLDISSRLQWAAILTASVILPDDRYKMTGAEAAIELIRQCMINRPLKKEEHSKLESIFHFSFEEPCLAIMCSFLKTNSQRLQFLHSESVVPELDSNFIKEASIFYEKESLTQENFRKMLHQKEYRLNAGRNQKESEKNKKFVEIKQQRIVKDDFVSKLEDQLNSYPTLIKKEQKEFPFKMTEKNTIQSKMMDDLKNSWKKHIGTPQMILNEEKKKMCLIFLEKEFKRVELHRIVLEYYLMNSILIWPESETINKNLMMNSNLIATPTFTDLLKSSYDAEHPMKMNPFLSKESLINFQNGCLKYLELCSLEQKFERLLSLKSDKDMFLKELMGKRKWNIEEHPRWLAFEVEGNIQIRNDQYSIAQHLIENPQAICQLNMGEGKTRVILPMLILYYSSMKKCVRVHIMKPLLQETIDFFQYNLTASSFNLFLMEQPFHRDINITESQVRILQNIMKNGCCQIISPEYRLSLKLKSHEIKQNNSNIEKELKKLFGMDWIDIMDESDALMEFKYQLTYSIGTPAPLVHCDARYEVAESLLRVLNQSDIIGSLFKDPKFGSTSTVASKSHFKKFQLVPLKSDEQEQRNQFNKIMVEELFKMAPKELYWIEEFKNDEKYVQLLMNDILNTNEPISSNFEQYEWYPQLLALRGFIGHRLLEHCLEQIFRVNYGIDPKRKKKLAVPFKHADVPTSRSEFSHPDVGIFLTLFSYYNDGLTMKQFRESISTLLRTGKESQNHFYNSWVEHVLNEITLEEKLKIDKVIKVDPSNQSQMELLYSKLKKSTELVNFYANNHIFNIDTAQYPKRISASAWDLADGKWTIGFSGTNDNHILYPLQVKQKEPNIPALIGINGKMLDLILKKTIDFNILDNSKLSSTNTVGHLLLDFAIKSKANALIDTGSLLAGISNDVAAQLMIQDSSFNSQFRGVCYFNTNDGRWVIIDGKTRKITERNISHIPEKDTFVIFDEARTRGADMKLNFNAIALITLGEGITKDKFMQGAGRMRKLQYEQKLRIISLPNIADSVLSLSEVENEYLPGLLPWIITNTQLNTIKGLHLWMKHGLEFERSKKDPTKAEIDENWELEAAYAGNIENVTYHDYICERVSEDEKELEPIVKKIEIYGKENYMTKSSCTEESEKEVQIIQETQEETEKEILIAQPRMEKSWDYQSILKKHFSVFKIDPTILTWSDVSQLFTDQLKSLNLSHLYCTKNFMLTTKYENDIDQYLRYGDFILYFVPFKRAILISDFEANSIRELLWETQTSSVLLTNLFMIKDGIYNGMSLGARNVQIPEHVIANIQLFNAETTFSNVKRKQTISNIIKSSENTPSSIIHLILSRFLSSSLPYSDLDKIMKTGASTESASKDELENRKKLKDQSL